LTKKQHIFIFLRKVLTNNPPSSNITTISKTDTKKLRMGEKYMTNSSLLKEKIKEMGLTQAKVADLIEVSPCSISYKINGARDFTVNEMSTLCEILKIDDKTSVFFA